MSVDWAAVAAEVDGAIKSISSDGLGYTAALRVDGERANAFEAKGETTYHTLILMENMKASYDENSGVQRTKRMLFVSPLGPVIPTKDDKVAVGIKAEDVTSATKFEEIVEVMPYSPAGTVLYYEIELAR